MANNMKCDICKKEITGEIKHIDDAEDIGGYIMDAHVCESCYKTWECLAQECSSIDAYELCKKRTAIKAQTSPR